MNQLVESVYVFRHFTTVTTYCSGVTLQLHFLGTCVHKNSVALPVTLLIKVLVGLRTTKRVP